MCGRIHHLNEEIKKQENRTQKKQKESGIYLPARESAKGPDELRRYSLQPGFFANAVKRTDDRVTRKAAPESPELVVHPNRKLIPIAPSQSRPNRKSGIPKQCQ
jgi:hypothetical protein